MKDITGALGRGWSFPPKFTPQDGVITVVDYERIEQSILAIFSTLPGERVKRESFGCDLHQFMFMNINSTLFARISSAITDSILRDEPRVDLLDVAVTKKTLEPYHLDVSVVYRVRDSDKVQQVTGKLNLSTGNRWGGIWENLS